MRITNMQHRDMKGANFIGKMVPIDLLNADFPQIFSL